MKTKILVFTLLLLPTLLWAQRRTDEATIEMIKTKKIAFITEKVGLTSQEAEKFWPVYNQLQKERYNLLDQQRKLEEQFQSTTPTRSEAEYKKMATDFVTIQLKEGKLAEEYNIKLLGILPADKVVKLYVAEIKFRSYLFHEMRKNQEQKGKN